jgi:hypothetical protein
MISAPNAQEAKTIQEIADLLTHHIEQQPEPKHRDQHPKQHGCVQAQFCVEPHLWAKLPDAYRVGLFAQPQVFDAWARFSNFKEQDDAKGDIHGLGIKVIVSPQVQEGEPSAGTTTQEQDFIFIDWPVFFMKNVQPYLEILQLTDLVKALRNTAPVETSSANKLSLILQLIWRLLRFLMPSLNPHTWRFRELFILVTAQRHKKKHRIASPLTETYWSNTPYRLGKGSQAVRYIVKPSILNETPKPKHYTANYLSEAMVRHLTQQQQGARFDFYLQVKDAPTTADIEDPTREWQDATSHKIAVLKISPQNFYPDQQPAFGEDMAFTPWNCLSEHEPLGKINLIRRQSYQQTAHLRRQQNTPTPIRTPLPPQVLPGKVLTGQNALTVIVPIKPDALPELTTLLQTVSEHIDSPHNPYFAQSPATHLARWVILDVPELAVKPHLLFSSNYDGTFGTYMQELVECLGAQMAPIWSLCDGHNDDPDLCRDVEKFAHFMQTYALPTQAFYVGCRNTSVQEILQNRALRQQIEQLTTAHATQLTPTLATLGKLTPQRLPEEPLPELLVPLLGPMKQLALNLQPFVGVFPKRNDPSERFLPLPEQAPRMERCSEIEDRVLGNVILPNQMTTLSPIKSDFHKQMLRLVLWLVNLAGSVSRGELAGIPSIHFARWVIIDKGRLNDSNTHYLLFESNYRGSWDNYLDDFVYKTLIPMNLIWGNLEGFPVRGCRDIEQFKQHQRPRQLPAQVFYCAYPELSVQNILCDRALATAVRDVKDYLSGNYNALISIQDHWLMRLVKRIAH